MYTTVKKPVLEVLENVFHLCMHVHVATQLQFYTCDCLCKNQPEPSPHKNFNSFLAQLVAILNNYPHTMSSMARLKWSAFLREGLQPCKTMTDTLAPVEHTNWAISAWNSALDQNGVLSAWLYMVRTICGQLVTSCLYLGRFSSSLPTRPSPLPSPTPL